MPSMNPSVFKRHLAVGTVLRCVENTYSITHGIDRSGKLATITKTGTNVFSATMDGKPYRMELPRRAYDVVSVSDERITYRIGRDDHTVTWEIVSPAQLMVADDGAIVEAPRIAAMERHEAMRLFAPAPNQIPGQLTL